MKSTTQKHTLFGAVMVLAIIAASCVPPAGTQQGDILSEDVFKTTVYVSWSGINAGGASSSIVPAKNAGTSRGVIWIDDESETYDPEDAFSYYTEHVDSMNEAFQTLFDATTTRIRLVKRPFDDDLYNAVGTAGDAYRLEIDTYRIAKYRAALQSAEDYWEQFDTGGDVLGDIDHRNGYNPRFGEILTKIAHMGGLIGTPVCADIDIESNYEGFALTEPAIETYHKGLASVWLGSLRGPVEIKQLGDI
jgi:hypothetical protein